MKRRTKIVWGGVAAIGLICALVGFWFEPNSLTFLKLDVQTPHWPAKTAPVRIVLLSDIHVDHLHMTPTRVRDIVKRVNALHPDLILLAGDYIGGDFWNTGPVRGKRALRKDNAFEEDGLRALDGFDAPLGTYAIMGNHDCWWSCERVREVLAETRVHLLENQNARIARPGGDIWIVGIEDGQTQKPDFAVASAGVPEDAATIVLEHNPGLFDWPSNHLPLQMSGHTHAGQVRLPLIGGLASVSRHSEDTADGFQVVGDRVLIVTRGLGESGLPVRFGAPPQVMQLTVHPGATAQVTVQ